LQAFMALACVCCAGCPVKVGQERGEGGGAGRGGAGGGVGGAARCAFTGVLPSKGQQKKREGGGAGWPTGAIRVADGVRLYRVDGALAACGLGWAWQRVR